MEKENKTKQEKEILKLKKEMGFKPILKYTEKEIKVLYEKNKERLNKEIERIKKVNPQSRYIKILEEEIKRELFSFWMQEEFKQNVKF